MSSSSAGFSLAEVLAVARQHPFYNPDAKFPPDKAAIQAVKAQTNGTLADDVTLLQRQPVLHKKYLYHVIERLVQDRSPENTFRRSIYASTTGGGSGAKPLFFATDAAENRRQRAEYGRLLRAIGVVQDTDWVVSVHTSGGLYRSLDLTLEILENAGASVLALGHFATPAEAIKLARDYHANVLSGDSSQVVRLVHEIGGLKEAERRELDINKIIYTSETLTPGQRRYIHDVLGPDVRICSFLGSAEAGPYAISAPHLVESGSGDSQAFVFDTRQILIEILPLSTAEGTTDDTPPTPLPHGQQGLVAQTSLSRLRNPVVRYLTGDVGSVHELPASAREHVAGGEDGDDWSHLRVLRLKGRDARFSFEWAGNYIEFDRLTAFMSEERHGVLQWQVVLDKSAGGENSLVLVRVLSKWDPSGPSAGRDELDRGIEKLFGVDPDDGDRFRLEHVKGLSEFELSGTGRKVIRFIDRYNDQK